MSTLIQIASKVSIDDGRILYVATTGNDSTGTIGDLSKPYLTIEAAVSAAVSGDLIYVFTGTYNLTTTASAGIAKDGVTYYFQPNTTVNKATTGAIFNITGFTTGFNVYGLANFNKTGSGTNPIFLASANAFDFTFEAQDVTNTVGQCFNLSLNAKNGSIRCRHVKSTASVCFIFPGVYFNNDSYYIIADTITSTASYAVSFSQGTGGRFKIDANFVSSTTTYAINNLYYTPFEFNITTCSGVTYAYYIGPQGVGSINGNASSIYNQGYINYNGVATFLYNFGVFNGGNIAVPTVSAGEATFNWIGSGNYANTLTVNGGIAYVTVAHNNQYTAPANITSGKLYLSGVLKGDISYSQFVINGASAEMIFTGNFLFASTVYQAVYAPFNLVNGTLRIYGNVENKISTNGNATCVLYQGGNLIINGASLTTGNSQVPPIICSGSAKNLRVYSGGLTTNRTENGGTLTAKKQKYKFTVSAVATTSITLNDGTGGNETFTESNTAVYNTTALLAQRMVTLINASGTLDLTATQDTPGTDTYFYVEADVAGAPYTIPATTNLSALSIRENSYLMTEIVGGTIIENANVI